MVEPGRRQKKGRNKQACMCLRDDKATVGIVGLCIYIYIYTLICTYMFVCRLLSFARIDCPVFLLPETSFLPSIKTGLLGADRHAVDRCCRCWWGATCKRHTLQVLTFQCQRNLCGRRALF